MQPLWVEFSAERLDTCTFLQANKGLLSLVMSPEPLRKLELAEGKREPHKADLELLVQESGIGAKLFSRAVSAWTSYMLQ